MSKPHETLQCVACGRLGHSIGDTNCRRCGRRFGIRSMREVEIGKVFTLAHNIAIGAALCRAWTMGCSEYGYVGLWDSSWRPGCGRSAP